MFSQQQQAYSSSYQNSMFSVFDDSFTAGQQAGDFNASLDFARVFDEEYGVDGPMMVHVPNPLMSFSHQEDSQQNIQQPPPAALPTPPSFVTSASNYYAPSFFSQSQAQQVPDYQVNNDYMNEIQQAQQQITYEPVNYTTVFDAVPNEAETTMPYLYQQESGPEPVTSSPYPPMTTPSEAVSPQGVFRPIAARPTMVPLSLPSPLSKPPPLVSGKVSPTESSVGSGGNRSTSLASVASGSATAPVPHVFASPAVKAPDAPIRALSAYNFFFRDERDRIVHEKDMELTSERQKQLLHAHWTRDRTIKRRHRKTHGKIAFTTLSKLISQRWKEIDDTTREFYRQCAAKDWERYQKELEEYKKLTTPVADATTTPATTQTM